MNMDAVNKWLTALQSVAVIVGVAVAAWQLSEISSQSRVQAQTLQQAQQAASATLLLQLREKLDGGRFAPITAAIQEHDHSYPLLRGDSRGGKFPDLAIEQYVNNLEDIGYLVQERLIIPEMAYNHFSYDVEKAWCNDDVRRTVQAARKSDKSIIATSEPFYGRFENLAQAYLAKEHQSCKDIDSQ